MAVIVLADDDEDIRYVVTSGLRQAGHTVIAVTGSLTPDRVRESYPHLRAVLAKPFTGRQLRDCVHRILAEESAGL